MNTYDSPDFAVLKDIEGMLSADMKAFEGTFIRRLAGVADGVGAIVGGEVNA